MIAPENTRSRKVAQRLGFKPLRQDLLLGDPVTARAIERSALPR
ncbi:MAG TPA: hypothetical protein VGF95_00895 [Solirubrobacteraceae bacterium]